MKPEARLRAALDATKAIETKADSESRSMTADELKQHATHLEEARTIKAEIEARKQSTAMFADLGTPTAPAAQVHNNQQDEPFRSLGDQLQAVVRSSRRGATIDPRLIGIQERAALGSSEAVPSDGGFLVQTDFSAELIKKAHATGQLANRVRTIPISASANGIKINAIDESSRVTGSRWGGVQTYWLAEAGTPTAAKPKFRQITMDLQKLVGLYYATDEVLSDASALGAIADQAFTEEFGFIFDDTIYSGTGIGQPLGFMKSPALITVAKEGGQLADTLVVENLVKMYARMYPRSKQNAIWLINTDVTPQLYTMGITVGTGGSPIYMPPGGLSQAPYGTLFGRPVVEVEQASTIGDLGDIAFVDLSEYLWIEKGGVQSASSIHVQFLTDETAFRWVVRVNGQPGWNKELTPYKGANTVSPFVTLAAR